MWINTLAVAAHNRWWRWGGEGGGVFSQNPEHPVGIVNAGDNRAVSNITSLRVDFELSKQVYEDIKLIVFFFPSFFSPWKGFKKATSRSGTDRRLPSWCICHILLIIKPFIFSLFFPIHVLLSPQGQREEHISPLILSWFTYLHTRSHAIRSTFIDGLCTAGKPMAQPTSINLRLPVGKDRRTSKRERSRSSSELQSTTALDPLNSPPASVRKSSQSSCLDSKIIVLRAQTVEAWI